MSSALELSLEEQVVRLRGRGAPAPPAPLLDVEHVQVDVPGATLSVVKPRDWPALREAEATAGRPAPYWASLWPSGIALARRLAAEDLDGVDVLELGCGLGLAAAAAARAGADVLATDDHPDAVAFAAHTLALNDCPGEVEVASWPELAARERRFTLVIAADVLYRRDNASALARALDDLVDEGGEVLIADPGRGGAAELWPMLRRRWRRRISAGPGESGVRLHRLARRGPA